MAHKPCSQAKIRSCFKSMLFSGLSSRNRLCLCSCRCQEVALERYEKTVAPRLADERNTQLVEEQVLRQRRAQAMDAADSAAVEQQCARILTLVDVSALKGGLACGLRDSCDQPRGEKQKGSCSEGHCVLRAS